MPLIIPFFWFAIQIRAILAMLILVAICCPQLTQATSLFFKPSVFLPLNNVNHKPGCVIRSLYKCHETINNRHFLQLTARS